nr:DUF4825 domain-containing protein [Planomicrobium sp. CPCC 101110]
MNRAIDFLFISLFVLVFLSGCISNAKSAEADLFSYKGSYVGDNSAVVNTVIQLKGAEHFSGVALQTKEEPYGIIIDYDWAASEEDEQKTVIHNASYLFALIQNVDWVVLNFETAEGVKEFKITREELESWYNLKLSEVENEEKLTELIQTHSEDAEEIAQLLK